MLWIISQCLCMSHNSFFIATWRTDWLPGSESCAIVTCTCIYYTTPWSIYVWEYCRQKGHRIILHQFCFLILCFIWLKVIYICIYIYIFATQKFITGFEFTQVYIYTYPVFKSQMAFHKDFGVWHWCIHHLTLANYIWG